MTRQMGMASIPSAATPTEAKLAYAAGAVGVCLDDCIVDQAWVEAGEYCRITDAAKNLIAAIG